MPHNKLQNKSQSILQNKLQNKPHTKSQTKLENISESISGSYMSSLSGSHLTRFIKLQTMKYFRFDKKCTLTCTEGINNADVNCITSNSFLIEVEIKISKADFRKEFNGESKIKLLKHQRYNSKYTQSGKSYKNYFVPNMFYFCTTEDLAPYIEEKLEALGFDNYGILICQEYRPNYKNSHIEVYRVAHKLHKQKINQKCSEKLMKRVSNENISNLDKSI